jgi:sugar lactone lactonase YvrE
MVTTIETSVADRPAIGQLAFPECPRWHANAWWFSDMHAQRVYRIRDDGALDTVLQLDDRPAGLSFVGDSMYVVSMTKRALLEVQGGAIVRRIDLSRDAPSHCNDMVMDARRRAYIGNFGFDFEAHQQPCSTNLLMVQPDGSVSQVADGLMFPNGAVLSDDGTTLIVAESYANRLTSFKVADDGTLDARDTFARFEKRTPDGICLDAKGAIWMASPPTREVLRVERGGRVTHVIKTPVHALACMLGGEDGRTLFICSAPLARPEKTRAAQAGRIDMVRVDTPHAGRP